MHDKPNTLRVRNWAVWQSYRSDRGQPPWIKLHRCVMRNPEWVGLTDAQRGQLVAIWLLAADQDGVIPASRAVLRKLCYLDSEPDLELFVNQGFLEGDASVAPPRRQSDATEEETETEAETEAEADKKRAREKPRAARARRWGDGEQVSSDWVAWAMDQGMTEPDAAMQALQFADYWQAKAGAQASKRNWEATWRNWIRRHLNDYAKPNGAHTNGRQNGTGHRGQRTTHDILDEALADLERETAEGRHGQTVDQDGNDIR